MKVSILSRLEVFSYFDTVLTCDFSSFDAMKLCASYDWGGSWMSVLSALALALPDRVIYIYIYIYMLLFYSHD